MQEQAFTAAFESVPIGVAILAPDWRVLRANPALCGMLGYTADRLCDLAPGAFFHPDEWRLVLARREQLIAGAAPGFEAELRLLRRDGDDLPSHLTCALLRDAAGRPLHFILHVQDLTGAESALADTEARLRTARDRLRQQDELLDQARDAIVVHDLDRTLRYWNGGAERMFGFRREQALGQTFESLMGPGAVLSPAAGAELLENGQWTGELECIDAQGRVVIVERRCTMLPGSGGEPASVLALHTDVTERRRAEKEIVLLNNVLEQRIRKRTAELEESNEDLRDFAYSLAHDLRAPLASIGGFSAQLELRLGPQLDDRSAHYLQRVRAGVKLMGDLTDALLALADLSNTLLLHQSVDLSAVARAIMERLREQEPARAVTFTIEETPRAQGDVRLLTDVLENLLGNAWKFTSRLPQAHIVFGGEAWPDGSYLYHVKDNGAGFDPAYAYKLFGPFQRLHTAAEFDGTGIGLAMVRKIVSRHGGRVWAESAVGGGASFYFTLNETASRGVAREGAAKAAVQ